jgi:hypothetical protein
VLSWDLDVSTVIVPRILAQPLSRSVGLGETVTFSVDAIGPSLSYQWFLDVENCLGNKRDAHVG